LLLVSPPLLFLSLVHPACQDGEESSYQA